MATQQTTTSNSKSNNNNQYKTTTNVGKVGLTGDDFSNLAVATLALYAKNRQSQTDDFNTVVAFQQQGLTQLVEANAQGLKTVVSSINPGDLRQYLPFVLIGVATLGAGALVWNMGKGKAR